MKNCDKIRAKLDWDVSLLFRWLPPKYGKNGHLIICATFRSNFLHSTNKRVILRTQNDNWKRVMLQVWKYRIFAMLLEFRFEFPHLLEVRSTSSAHEPHRICSMYRLASCRSCDDVYWQLSTTQTHSQNLNLSAIRSFWLSLTKHLVMMGGL